VLFRHQPQTSTRKDFAFASPTPYPVVFPSKTNFKMQTKLLLALVAALLPIVGAAPVPGLSEKRSEELEMLYPGPSKRAPTEELEMLYPGPSKRSPEEELEMLYPGPSKRSPEEELEMLYPGPSKRSPEEELEMLYPGPSKRSPTEELEMLYPGPSKRSAEAGLSADFADK